MAKISRLELRNVRSLEHLTLEPPPEVPVVYVVGPGGSGKSTVLDSILFALAGKRAIPPGVVRNGAEAALVELTLDNGDTVRRRITAEGATLTVTRKDGATLARPQQLLDGLINPIAMDPWAWCNGTARERRDAVLAVAGVEAELEELEQRAAKAYENRRTEGRVLERLRAQLGSAGELPVEAGLDPVDLAPLRAARDAALREEGERLRLQDRMASGRARLREITAQQAALEAERQQIVAELSAAVQVKAAPAVRLEEHDRLIGEAEQHNRAMAEAEQLRGLRLELEAQAAAVAREEQALEEARAGRAALMEQIRRKLPIRGLEINAEGELVVGGVLFPQLSTSQRLRVACTLARMGAPELRLLRIKDGSVLDLASRKYLDALAREHDLQIWVEDVRETGAVQLELVEVQ